MILPVKPFRVEHLPHHALLRPPEINNMSWRDVMTSDQQRNMAYRLVAATPMAAPTPQTIVVPVRDQTSRRKDLMVDNFSGKPGESVEAGLARGMEEAKNQEYLGGDTWTAGELFHGAVQYLKGRTRSGTSRSRRTWSRATQHLGKRVQQPGERLRDFADSLLGIGFGKRVSAESYVEAFLNGLNNGIMATQARGADPSSLEDADQYAENRCGEYGEGRRITDWRIGEDDNSPPVYDTPGKTVSGCAATAKKDPLSLDALQALMTMAEADEDQLLGTTDLTRGPSRNERRRVSAAIVANAVTGEENLPCASPPWAPRPPPPAAATSRGSTTTDAQPAAAAAVPPGNGPRHEEVVSARVADGELAANAGSRPDTRSVVSSQAEGLAVQSAAEAERKAGNVEEQKTDTEDDGAQRSLVSRLAEEDMSRSDGVMPYQRIRAARKKLAATEITAAVAGELPVTTQPPPRALMRKQLLISGGVTKAPKRRQCRTEGEQAAARRILTKKLGESPSSAPRC
ncbi:unnamed protein product [Phytophthora fragariaefolia]|uniref:Unnamed protein product n=1 Tax=Phytophthora fragariaefolia TaxID=1490495 RepID=A0A9W7D827_9STRA|nr:unnamed protein product [Phytophthora fragariaefolia]